MPSPPRAEVPGGIHHVFNRGNNGRVVFHTDDDRRSVLAKLRRIAEELGWNCLTYCLMGNHVHFLIETSEPNLSVGMHRLGTHHAQLINAGGERGYGRLCQHPFGSRLVDTPAYLAHLFRYIALNPVTERFCERPEDWVWSAHRALISGTGGPLAAVERVQALLEESGGAPERRYARLFDESGPCGPWTNAVSPDPPRPPIADLIEIEGDLDAAMHTARWTFEYLLREIAEAVSLSEPTICRRTRRR